MFTRRPATYQMEFKRKYDEDEILIFSGKFADEFTRRFFSAVQNKVGEIVRNAVADNVESVMKNYKGDGLVPLPADLKADMHFSALDAAVIALRDQLTPSANFGLTE